MAAPYADVGMATVDVRGAPAQFERNRKAWRSVVVLYVYRENMSAGDHPHPDASKDSLERRYSDTRLVELRLPGLQCHD
jgi:hypothetical protein